MKKNRRHILVLLILITFLYLSFKNLPKPNVVGDSTDKNGSVEISAKPLKSKFEVGIIKVTNPQNLFLFSNVLSKKSASKLFLEKNCESVVSGGFYTKEDKHIGLFISEFQQIASEHKNSFYNGFVSIFPNSETSVSSLPPENPRISIQSGPLIVKDSEPKKLYLKNDESARRIVVATTENKSELLFLAIYDSENNLFGPTLVQLPEYIVAVSNERKLKIVNALNLDGGSHSAFITKSIEILEAQNAGSIFCLTN